MSNAIEHTVGKFLKNLQIHSDEENDKAIVYLEALTNRWESGEEDLEPIIDYLTSQIKEFETKHYPVEKPTPDRMLSYFMEQHNHSQSDLSEIAPQSVISKILSGKREMNLKHIRKISKLYGVSPETFI